MKRLEAPPHVPHWVRYNYRDLDRTIKEILGFARSFPKYTYSHAMKLLGDRLQFRAEWETLLKSAKVDGRANSRYLCVELLEAFQLFEQTHDLVGYKAYDFEVLPWRISADVSVPVKPLTTLLKNGRLEPVFVFGWADFPLDDFQIRLMMTVIEDALFSLSDYQNSKGHFIVLPRVGKSRVRKGRVWHRGDYDLLTSEEVSVQVDTYLKALEVVKKTIARTDEVRGEAHIITPDPRQEQFVW